MGNEPIWKEQSKGMWSRTDALDHVEVSFIKRRDEMLRTSSTKLMKKSAEVVSTCGAPYTTNSTYCRHSHRIHRADGSVWISSLEIHPTPIDEPYGSRLLPWQSSSCTFLPLLLSSRCFFYISLSYNSLLLARTHGLREKNSPSLSPVLSAVFIPYFSLGVSLSLCLHGTLVLFRPIYTL